METMKNYLIFALLLVVLALVSRLCHRPDAIIQEKWEVRVDTIRTTSTIYEPQVVSVEVLRTDTLYIDTAATIEDYYTSKVYELRHEDTSGSVDVTAYVSKNAIDSVQFWLALINQTRTHTITEIQQPPKYGINIGAALTADKNRAGVAIIAGATIRKHGVSLFYDPFNTRGGISYSYKIWQK